MTRWSLVVSEETDRALRTFLARSGGKKGDLSRFVEEAVRFRLFHLTAERIKDRNQQFDQNLILTTIDDAVEWNRATRS